MATTRFILSTWVAVVTLQFTAGLPLPRLSLPSEISHDLTYRSADFSPTPSLLSPLSKECPGHECSNCINCVSGLISFNGVCVKPGRREGPDFRKCIKRRPRAETIPPACGTGEYTCSRCTRCSRKRKMVALDGYCVPYRTRHRSLRLCRIRDITKPLLPPLPTACPGIECSNCLECEEGLVSLNGICVPKSVSSVVLDGRAWKSCIKNRPRSKLIPTGCTVGRAPCDKCSRCEYGMVSLSGFCVPFNNRYEVLKTCKSGTTDSAPELNVATSTSAASNITSAAVATLLPVPGELSEPEEPMEKSSEALTSMSSKAAGYRTEDSVYLPKKDEKNAAEEADDAEEPKENSSETPSAPSPKIIADKTADPVSQSTQEESREELENNTYAFVTTLPPAAEDVSITEEPMKDSRETPAATNPKSVADKTANPIPTNEAPLPAQGESKTEAENATPESVTPLPQTIKEASEVDETMVYSGESPSSMSPDKTADKFSQSAQDGISLSAQEQSQGEEERTKPAPETILPPTTAEASDAEEPMEVSDESPAAMSPETIVDKTAAPLSLSSQEERKTDAEISLPAPVTILSSTTEGTSGVEEPMEESGEKPAATSPELAAYTTAETISLSAQEESRTEAENASPLSVKTLPPALEESHEAKKPMEYSSETSASTSPKSIMIASQSEDSIPLSPQGDSETDAESALPASVTSLPPVVGLAPEAELSKEESTHAGAAKTEPEKIEAPAASLQAVQNLTDPISGSQSLLVSPAGDPVNPQLGNEQRSLEVNAPFQKTSSLIERADVASSAKAVAVSQSTPEEDPEQPKTRKCQNTIECTDGMISYNGLCVSPGKRDGQEWQKCYQSGPMPRLIPEGCSTGQKKCAKCTRCKMHMVSLSGFCVPYVLRYYHLKECLKQELKTSALTSQVSPIAAHKSNDKMIAYKCSDQMITFEIPYPKQKLTNLNGRKGKPKLRVEVRVNITQV